MSSHVWHETWDPGFNAVDTAPVLADGCARCDEHAAHPDRALDAFRIAELRRRTRLGLEQQSRNDLAAARALEVPR